MPFLVDVETETNREVRSLYSKKEFENFMKEMKIGLQDIACLSFKIPTKLITKKKTLIIAYFSKNVLSTLEKSFLSILEENPQIAVIKPEFVLDLTKIKNSAAAPLPLPERFHASSLGVPLSTHQPLLEPSACSLGLKIHQSSELPQIDEPSSSKVASHQKESEDIQPLASEDPLTLQTKTNLCPEHHDKTLSQTESIASDLEGTSSDIQGEKPVDSIQDSS